MKKNILIILLLLILAVVIYLWLKPTGTEKVTINHDMVLEQVEELGRLELIKYNIRDIIEYRKMRDWLPNSKTVLIVVGEVTACVDLSKINKEDIYVKEDSVNIILPIPEICHFKIDHARSRVYDVQYGLWDTYKLVDEAYRDAEQQIYSQALKMGIAEESRESAIKFLTPLLNNLGFKKVSLQFKSVETHNTYDNRNINIIPQKQ